MTFSLASRPLSWNAIYTIGTVDRGVKYNVDKPQKEQYSFIRKTDMPAVLVECCFIDSEDVTLLLDDEIIDLFARCIACGITDFISKK